MSDITVVKFLGLVSRVENLYNPNATPEMHDEIVHAELFDDGSGCLIIDHFGSDKSQERIVDWNDLDEAVCNIEYFIDNFDPRQI